MLAAEFPLSPMNILSAIFSWRPPLSRRAFLGHGLLAAIVFVCSLLGSLLACGQCDYIGAFGVSDILLATMGLLLLLGAACSPLVPLVFITVCPSIGAFLYYARFPELPAPLVIPCALLLILLALGCLLRLMALMVRRRRAAGRSPWLLFSLSGALYLGLLVLTACFKNTDILLMGMFLVVVMQGVLLLRPAQHPLPPLDR